MQLTVGLETLNSYKRLSYSAWYALAEFVDNSTQAYIDNRKALDASYKKNRSRLLVAILYDRDAGTLSIKDNSIGMSEKELEEALRIAPHPAKDGGRSKYGMGMKTAACWFGDLWTVKTKKLGEPQAVTVTVDVPLVASGNGRLIPERTKEDPKFHYTEITISKLHRHIQGRTIPTIKDYLRSIYRCDLKDGMMTLLFQGEPLNWDGLESRILRADDGSSYKKDIEFSVNGKKVKGWVAVLESGGRPFGGFSLIQNNRVIQGYPESWKPRKLFGQLQGSNDLVNQRLCGELVLDGFEVNHTKDGISWQEDEEEIVERELYERCADYRIVAKTRRKGDRRGPSQLAIDNAISQVTKELSSGEMIDAIELTEIPPENILKRISSDSVRHAAKGKPKIDVQVGDMHVRFYVDPEASPSDPYYALDWKPNGTVEVAINQNHEYMVQLGDDVADFIRQCIYDGIAEFKANRKKGRVEPNTFRFIKDNLLRVPFKLNDDADDDEEDES